MTHILALQSETKPRRKKGRQRDRRHHEEEKGKTNTEGGYGGDAYREIRGGRTRERWMERKREKRGRVTARARYTGREGMFSSAADQMIHDKLAQCTDLWGHPGR